MPQLPGAHRTKALLGFLPSRLRRHHSVNEFVPYGLRDILRSVKAPRAMTKHRSECSTTYVSNQSVTSLSQELSSEDGSDSSDATFPRPPAAAPSEPPVLETRKKGTTGTARMQNVPLCPPPLEPPRQQLNSGQRVGQAQDARSSEPKKERQVPWRSGEPGRPTLVTTLMVRNIPHKVTQSTFRAELDSSGFTSKYDFAYLPMCFMTRSNNGYAFVNFDTPEAANQFVKAWHRSNYCGAVYPTISVAPAAIQGLDANMRKWGPRVERIRDAALRPFVRNMKV